MREFGQHGALLHVGKLVAEQHVAMAHGDHIVVEDAGVDGERILLREDDALGREAVTARDGGRGFARLPRRETRRHRSRTVAVTAVDEKLDAGLVFGGP